MSATIPESDGPPTAPLARRWINPRLMVIFVLLLAVICASVIAADYLSPRDRHAGMLAPVAPSAAEEAKP